VKDLPLIKDDIKDPKKYAIFRAWAAQMDFQRQLTVAPGTPKDRLAVLRNALAQTLKDPELLAEAKKSKLIITAVSGEKPKSSSTKFCRCPPRPRKVWRFSCVRQRLEAISPRRRSSTSSLRIGRPTS